MLMNNKKSIIIIGKHQIADNLIRQYKTEGIIVQQM